MASTENAHDTGHTPLTLGLAMVAGLGVVLMMSAGAIGVIEGDAADAGTVGLLFLAGLAAFIAGTAGWAGVVRPWENFDDINEPQYHGHEHPEPHPQEQPGEVNVETPVPPQTT